MNKNIRNIFPIDKSPVLKPLPQKRNLEQDDPNAWTAVFVDLLSENRNACKPTISKKMKVCVEPGKSILKEDFQNVIQAKPSTKNFSTKNLPSDEIFKTAL